MNIRFLRRAYNADRSRGNGSRTMKINDIRRAIRYDRLTFFFSIDNRFLKKRQRQACKGRKEEKERETKGEKERKKEGKREGRGNKAAPTASWLSWINEYPMTLM